MREMLKKMSREVRNELGRRFDGGVAFDKGAFHMAPEPLRIVQAVAGLTSTVGSSEVVNLPSNTEREREIVSLGNLLVTSLLEHKGRLRFITPVCPDYSQESSASFYQTIGEGISPQAQAAMRAARFIGQTFPHYGFDPKVEILVADTEDDIPEVMDRCVNGDSQVYKGRCLASVGAIKDDLNGAGDIVDVTTFTLGLGGQFRQTQYEYEDVIRRLRGINPKFDQEVQKLGDMRKDRHSKILGRREADYELTIRYMAQYAALGTLARRLEEPTILLNYPTPNLPFYNAAAYRDSQFALSDVDTKVVPIMETVL